MIDAPDPAAAGAQPDSPAPRPRTWQGATRQTIYLLLVLLACIFLFRLLGPKKKEPSIDDLFQPGKTDIEFLDAINYLEKYYEQHPELKRGNVVQKADEAEESGPGGGTAGDASSADRAPDAAASAESAP
jgi:hypothetical protein